MKLLGAAPPRAIGEPLAKLHDNVCKAGFSPPSSTVVEDAGGVWQEALAGLSLGERRSMVLVARTNRSLALAVRWSVGGAVLLPASSAALKAAFEAAETASRRPLWMADLDVVSVMLEDEATRVVELIRPDLWHSLVGQRRALEALMELAVVVERPPLMGAGPRLVLRGVSEEVILNAWNTMAEHPVWSRDLGISFSAAAHRPGAVKPTEQGTPPGSWPIAELPSGKNIGRWALSGQAPDEENSFIRQGDGSWIRHEPGADRQIVPELVATEDLDLHAGEIVRLAGFIVSDLDRPGSPGAVLVQSFLREVERRGRRLWLPGVDRSTLGFVLRLGRTVLVDGTVVPD